MKYGVFMEQSWNLFWNALGEPTQKFIEKHDKSYKSTIYCTFINWVESVLNNYRYYAHNIEEISEECIYTEILRYSDALVIIMTNECGLKINKNVATEVINFIKENKEALYV